MRNLIILTAISLTFAGAIFAAPPANDNFANAEVLPSQASITNISGTTVDATLEAGDPAQVANSGIDNTVWYVWTAPQSGEVSVSTICAADHDSLVFIGNSLISGKIIRRDAAAHNCLLEFYAIQGVTYYFSVATYSYNDNPFSLSLGYTRNLDAGTLYVPPLSNDDYADAVPFNSPGQKAVFYTRGATFEPFETQMLASVNAQYYDDNDGGVWATWQAPTSGKATVAAQSIEGEDVVVVVGRGASLNDFRQNLIGAGIGGGEFTCVAGQTYTLYFLCESDNQVLAQISSKVQGSGGTPAPFAAFAGTYTELFGSNGWIQITLTPSGIFSGKAIINGVAYSFKGKLDAAGDFSGFAKGGTVPVQLDIDTAAVTGVPGLIEMDGSAGGQAFTARHTVRSKSLQLAQTGKYTLLLNPTSSGASIPQGAGYALLNVKSNGTVTLEGKLADGSGFTAGGPLVGDGNGGAQLILFNRNIHSKTGLLAGALAFEEAANADITAMLNWNKPPQGKGTYYAGGFSTVLNAQGARYVKRPQQMALDFPLSTDNATFSATDGGITATVTESATLTAQNTVIVSGTNPNGLKVTINAAKGSMSGSFIAPGTTIKTKFGGVLFQKNAVPKAGGFFLGPVNGGAGLSGEVLLEP